jgi:hypothetical protein
MTDANDVPICTCNDDWHAYNAENHAPTCPVIAAFATLTRERDEARLVTARLCQWREDDPDFGTWRTGCGHLWSFNAGGPKENDTKFCQYCGGALDAALTQEDA